MDLAGHYLWIKTAHISLVSVSIGLFTLRALGVQARARWPMTTPVRRASVVIDTGLLTAGIALWSILQLRPDRDLWLGVKLVLVVAYIVLGSFALRRARTAMGRRLALVGAGLTVAGAAAVALAHDSSVLLRPLGLF